MLANHIYKNSHYPVISSIPQSNIVLYFDFANTACYPGTGTTILNLINNHITGTVNSVTFETTVGGEFLGDGVNDKSISTNLTTGYNPITISLWIRPHSANTGFTINKSSYYATGVSDFPIQMQSSLIANSALISDGGSFSYSAVATGYTDAADLNWVHTTLTYDNADLILYINGVLSAKTPSTTGIATTNVQPWTLFRAAQEYDGGIGGLRFNGAIAMALIYNRTLSANENSQIFNATRRRFKV